MFSCDLSEITILVSYYDKNNSAMLPEDFEKLENEKAEELKGHHSEWSPGINKETPKTIHLSGMYYDWFLDYASYVILERAVPHLIDGLKPVQRRILHSLKKLDDGRYNKVANIIGHTMQYHPHGDASIGEAIVQLGQHNLLIDTQGNWGNLLTGDKAAAPRYIEARLSKFALEILFSPKITKWKPSYDGRNEEPVTLPVKFPLLLTQGVEGIAVGLASKILPHNFNEIIDASIDYLNKKEFVIYPDFPTGGLADVSKYNDGQRGGIVKVRARIKEYDKKTLIITDLPFGETTTSLIDSIIKANDNGKIKIRKIDDNTAEKVEILIHLAPGTSPDKTIDALYAFTKCQTSIYPNCCVIDNEKPRFIGVKEMLKISTDNTVSFLKQELQIQLEELEQQWFFATLEKIFIENKIYRNIEKCETWDSIIETIRKGLQPHIKKLKKSITDDDIAKLTEIKIKRISKFDAQKADTELKNIEANINEVKNNLAHIISFTINYFKQIKKKYGATKERKTELRNFETIIATKVAEANQKLYINREEGFVGTGLKKDEFVCNCSDIDDIIVFRKDGTYMVTKIAEKIFIGKNIEHIAIFKKNDNRTVYNAIYRDGLAGYVYAKRFQVKGITRDKEYFVTQGKENSKLLYFSANPNGEAEIVRVVLKPRPKLRKLNFEFDFSQLAIKGRDAMGNILSKTDVHKITLKEQGVSTLGGQNIWYDPAVMRINTIGHGNLLGEFQGNDRILVIRKNGSFKLFTTDLENHFPEDVLIIEKFDNPQKIFSVIYFNGETKLYYIKRFIIEPTEKEQLFINEHPDTKLIQITSDTYPRLEIHYGGKDKNRPASIIDIHNFISVKGFKAIGKRISTFNISSLHWLEPIIKDEPVQQNNNPHVIEEELKEDFNITKEKKTLDNKPIIPKTSEKEKKISNQEIKKIKEEDKNNININKKDKHKKKIKKINQMTLF